MKTNEAPEKIYLQDSMSTDTFIDKAASNVADITYTITTTEG